MSKVPHWKCSCRLSLKVCIHASALRIHHRRRFGGMSRLSEELWHTSDQSDYCQCIGLTDVLIKSGDSCSSGALGRGDKKLVPERGCVDNGKRRSCNQRNYTCNILNNNNNNNKANTNKTFHLGRQAYASHNPRTKAMSFEITAGAKSEELQIQGSRAWGHQVDHHRHHSQRTRGATCHRQAPPPPEACIDVKDCDW